MMASAPENGKRLLVIDDDDGLREIFKHFMEREGYLVAEAEDGVVGLAKVPVLKPHLIVLDLMMPNLNGFDVLHRLQKDGLGHIPVIIITGYSESANEQILRQEPNVVEFLKKPIAYAELLKLIRRLLDQRA